MSSLFNSAFSDLPFASLKRLAADTGGGAGGGGEGESKTTADISTLPKAKARIAELDAEVLSLTNARDQALTAQRTAETERDQATKVGKDTAAERDQAKADLLTARGEVATLTGERDKAKSDLTAANTNVSRLEGLCGVRGIDPKQLPAAANDQTDDNGAVLYEQFSKLEGRERTAFYRKHEKALDAYGESLRKR